MPNPAVCVFCGAKSGTDPRWMEVARGFGEALARRGWAMVYGGGRVGLMGALADGALSAGGKVIGVIPQGLLQRELAHRALTQLEVVGDMAARKTRMIELSDAFVALPGGLGTLDELFEVLTLAQIGEHSKPVALLNQDGYWDPLLAACRAMVAAGFVHPRDIDTMGVAGRTGAVLDLLAGRLAQRPAAPA